MATKRGERLQVMLTLAEVEAVEEWRFAHRMPTRSAAVRALMNLGLKASASATGDRPLLDRTVASGAVGVVPSEEGADRAFAPARGPQVLVVARDFLLGQGYAAVLAQSGYHALGPATDSEEALILARQNPAKVAVIDLQDAAGDALTLANKLAHYGLAAVLCGRADGIDLAEAAGAAPGRRLISRDRLAQELPQALAALTEPQGA
ncbi:MAG: hypothetical protein ACFB22_06810 [Rhodothalassiaceae bacterium]